MTYATLMVHLQLGDANAGRLRVAVALADRFHAAVIGIAACQPLQVAYGDAYMSGDLVDQDRDDINKDIGLAETEFHTAFRSHTGTVEWRTAVNFALLGDYLAQQARCADLMITGPGRPGSVLVPSRDLNPGDLVMQAGRPVLVVPATAEQLKFEQVVVAWKDCRETRRAVLDALPMLQQAAHVSLVGIAADETLDATRAHLRDVAIWLRRHGVEVASHAAPSIGDDASQLAAIAREHRADIIVAGAYGHSRVREWVLGGVTRDLLLQGEICALVSH